MKIPELLGTVVTIFDGGQHDSAAAYMSCGTGHTIFLSQDGKAFSVRFGWMGQLGLGDDDEVEVARQTRSKALWDRLVMWTGVILISFFEVIIEGPYRVRNPHAGI